MIASVIMALAVNGFTEFLSTSAARRAAQVFAQDLLLARNSARRGEEAVVVRFYEGSRWYSVTTEEGRELVRRRFGAGEELRLSSIDLEVSGDSLRFDGRGVADLSGVTGPFGEASFTAGSRVFEVRFNALGASRVAER